MKPLFLGAAGVFCLCSCTGQIGGLDQENAGGGAAGTSVISGEGEPGTAGTAGAPDGPVTFACEGTPRFETPAMRRLSKRQYENTLRDLVNAVVGADDATVVWEGLRPALAGIPDEVRKQVPEDLHGSYRRLDQDVAQAHVDAWYEIATALGTALTAPSRLERVVGTCAVDADPANDAACVDDFVRTFGERAFRRPLTEAEFGKQRAFFGTGTGIDPLAMADVIAGMLSAPEFLYLIEHGAEERADRPGVFALDGYELAARLSYHFWETAPDAELLDAARTGALLALEEYERQVDRLFYDSRTRQTLREFVRDWLKLEDLSDLTRNVDQNLYKAFAGDALPGPELRARMIDEVLDLVDHFTWDEPGTLEDILTTNLSFARTSDLADIYGTTVWDGQSEPPALPDGQRPGILSRAALLATGTAMTRPILRGVFIRRTILCDEIPPPPDNAAAKPPELSSTLSTRQVVEALTETPGTACAACHGTYINPLGFAFEGFDALGRLRDRQPLFDDNGTLVGQATIDTRTIPLIATSEGEMSSGGPRDLIRLMLDSGKPQACLSRHYFRFTFGRWEDLDADGCVLESVRRSLTESGNFAELLRDVVTTDAFRERTFD